MLAAMSLALLMIGCGEEIAVPQVIECKVCEKEVSSDGENCPNCAHPIAKSVDAYKKVQELVRKRAEEEAREKAEQEEYLAEERRKRVEEETKERLRRRDDL